MDDRIADRWYEAQVGDAGCERGDDAMRSELRELTGQLLGALAADPVDRAAGRAVGARLARIGYDGPHHLASTVEVLGPALATAAGPGRASAAFALLGEVSAGHGDAARARLFAAQGERHRAELAALRQAERARQDSEVRYRAVFDHAGIGVLVVADSGEILEANDSACEVVGRDLTRMSIGDVWDLVHPRDRPSVIAMWEAVRAGSQKRGEWRLVRPSGQTGWVALTAAMVAEQLPAAVHPASASPPGQRRVMAGPAGAAGAGLYFVVTLEDLSEREDGRWGGADAGLGDAGDRDLGRGLVVGGAGALADDLAAADQLAGQFTLGGGERVPGRAPVTLARRRMADALASALVAGEIVVRYQPIVRLADATVAGAEALVRWEHPRLGLLTPEEFIGVAEESGLIVPLGLRVLETACRDAAAWPGRSAAAGPFVSVNVSVRQLHELGFVADVLTVLDRTGLDPSRLQLEVVENLLLDEAGVAGAAVRELAARGVRIALDDFGTGYSNLAYLTTLPVHGLKLASQFVAPFGERHPDPGPAGMVQKVVAIAHGFGHVVTVEGIENAQQAAHVTAFGADLGQGHLFARAMPADEFAVAVGSGLAAVGAAATGEPPRPAVPRPTGPLAAPDGTGRRRGDRDGEQAPSGREGAGGGPAD
ncbi:MAG: EAL domain-containing protein, partial [Frankia sp.]|nr:EAL domain-containing protein [Frankia sp.]